MGVCVELRCGGVRAGLAGALLCKCQKLLLVEKDYI